MVVVGDGRFLLPDNFFYTRYQHCYINPEKKLVGIDQIGCSILGQLSEISFLTNNELKVGEPFACISTEKGIATIISPCSGKIKKFNNNAVHNLTLDPYEKGYLVELEEITELDPTLIKGDELKEWAENEARSVIGMYYSFKVVEIGDSAVGKTAIKVRFTDDYFKQDLKTTLGVDFGYKEIKCEYVSSDLLFTGSHRFTAKINVWDAAGQSYFDKIRGMYYKNAHGCLLCYDVTNPQSFENLDKWLAELDENVGKKIPVLLVGNKIDLERKVPREKAIEYANKHGFLFVETSAKTGEGVEEAFKKLAIEMFKREEKLP